MKRASHIGSASALRSSSSIAVAKHCAEIRIANTAALISYISLKAAINAPFAVAVRGSFANRISDNGTGNSTA